MDFWKLSLAGATVLAALCMAAPARAMNGPALIQLDGGPLGDLQISGGMDGYGYYLSGTNRGGYPGSAYLTGTPFPTKSNGAEAGTLLFQVQKSDGIVQFNIEFGNTNTIILGAPPTQLTFKTFPTGALYVGSVTIAPPNSPVTISAGHMVSLEGYESAQDWANGSLLNSALFAIENNNSRGIEAVYSQGPLTATLFYGDGWDSGVFNFLQALAVYTFNPSNVLSVYYGGNLGRTGLNTFAYGGSTTGAYGTELVNSQMIGAFYSYTNGNLNLVPEVQFAYAKADAKANIAKPTSNFGVALFGNYTFGTSPYSVGGWVAFDSSHNSAADNQLVWFVGPDAEVIEAAISPTWQYKDLFVRANAGYLYLLNNKDATGVRFGYGNNNNGRGNFVGALEAGVLF